MKIKLENLNFLRFDYLPKRYLNVNLLGINIFLSKNLIEINLPGDTIIGYWDDFDSKEIYFLFGLLSIKKTKQAIIFTLLGLIITFEQS